jgi:hypothetical protein
MPGGGLARAGVAVLIFAIFGLAGIPAAFGQEPAPGTIGGPPTHGEFYEDPKGPLKPRSEAVVIGTGHTVTGRVELIAFDSKIGLCLAVDQFRLGLSGGCGGDAEPATQPVFISGSGFTQLQRDKFSDVTGSISPDVASLEVTAKHELGIRHPRAILGQADAAIAARVNQDVPFGFFFAAVKGCVPAQKFRAVAFNAAGERLGAARGIKSPFGGCGKSDFPGAPPRPPKPNRLSLAEG